MPSRKVKKLGRPASTPHMVDWNREAAEISAENAAVRRFCGGSCPSVGKEFPMPAQDYFGIHDGGQLLEHLPLEDLDG